MPLDVTSEIVIHRPRAVVAEYVFDPVNLAQWRSHVVSVRRQDAGATTPGARFDVRTKGRLRGCRRVDEVRAIDPMTGMTLCTVEGGAPLTTRLTVAPELRNSTRLTVRTTGDPGALSALVGRALRRTTSADLSRLKTILELARA